MFDAKKILLFLTLTGTNSSFADEGHDWANEVMPDESWHWDFQPKFVHCINKSKTSIKVYKQAIKYWKSKGYVTGSGKLHIEYCENSHDDLGKIRLAGEEGLEKGNYGVTTRRLVYITEFSGEVKTHVGSAYIRIEKEYANDLNMVIHELGHALGLSHKHEKDSVMYAYHVYENTKL